MFKVLLIAVCGSIVASSRPNKIVAPSSFLSRSLSNTFYNKPAVKTSPSVKTQTSSAITNNF